MIVKEAKISEDDKAKLFLLEYDLQCIQHIAYYIECRCEKENGEYPKTKYFNWFICEKCGLHAGTTKQYLEYYVPDGMDQREWLHTLYESQLTTAQNAINTHKGIYDNN